YTVFAGLTALDNAGMNLTHGRSYNWRQDITYRMLEEYTCALFVPFFFWLVFRFPIERHTWRRNAPILLGASLVCVVVKYTAIYIPLLRLIMPSDRMTWRMALWGNTGAVLLDFFSIIGVAHAIE